ncbi:phosphatidate cytidylyltransferase [Nicoletella semolina]|uniref:Phosphatidate cytidylyltransferase n=1 Tax=Nicoletella semolina TaxID=271160 RepID=A0A4R2NA33_9PAST|nr:phosphatidate cytidylyltransferase [Nicoletella semolina]MDH2925376.1 phosphatidate cytidylyltransferase [Nicoletella semolina]TCP17854.1 phosphatidate cytidylyltransferase [Nicoletella semolina]
MLKERIFSAIVMIILAMVAIFWLPPLLFTLILSSLIVLGMWEWSQFAGIKSSIGRIIVALIVASLLLLVIMATTHSIQSTRFLTDETTPWLFIGCIWWIIALALVTTYPKSASYWTKSVSAKFIFGVVTLLPFLISVLALRFYQYPFNSLQGTYLLLYVFLLVWGADSGAYFIGRAIGKRKLAVNVSPNKSLEGAIGGVLVAILIAVIFLQVSPEHIFGRKIGILPFMLLSTLTVSASILGDLTESMFKRQAGIKDSSNLISGHGGILDRIDSLTAAVPVFTTGFFFFL